MPNDFEKYRVSSPENESAKNPMGDQESQSGFHPSGVFNRLDRNILIGLANLGQSAANLPRNAVNLFSPETASRMPESNYNFAQAFGQEQTDPSDIFTQQISEIAPSFLLPGASLGKSGQLLSGLKGGKYLQAAASQGIPQGIYAGMLGLNESPEVGAEMGAAAGGITGSLSAISEMVRSGNPYLKLAGKAGQSVAGGYLGHQLGSLTGIPGTEELGGITGAVLGGRGINLNKNAKKTVLGEINPDEATKIVEASRRLGLDFVTPGEAIENPFIAQELARIGKTKEGAKNLYERGQERKLSEEKSIQTLMNDIYNEGLAPEKMRLYESSMETFVPDEIALGLMESSTIENAEKLLKNDPVYKDLLTGKQYDENTIGYWNQVKRVLDGQYNKTKDTTKKSLINNARKEIKSKLDAVNPDYKMARSIAEREINARELGKHFNKSEMTGNRFSKLLENKEEFSRLRNSLSAFPEIQDRLDDMLTVFPRLQNLSPTNKATSQLERTGMFSARNHIDAIRDYMQRNLYMKQDVEAVKLMTDPKWLEEAIAYKLAKGNVKKADKIKKDMGSFEGNEINKEIVGGESELSPEVLNLLFKMLGQGAAQNVSE